MTFNRNDIAGQIRPLFEMDDEIDYKIVYQLYKNRLDDFESYLSAIQAMYPP
jgi:hypothetical protein